MLSRWALVFALSMTPALIAGQSAAAALAIGYGFDWRPTWAVMAIAGFCQGMIVMWLADKSATVPFLKKFITRFHKPRAVAFADKWGPWGGLLLGVAVVGQEPILVALRWLEVDKKRIVLPLAASNMTFSGIYYLIVAHGWDQASSFAREWELLFN